MPKRFSQLFSALTLCALLAACASQPSETQGTSAAQGGYYKVGKPYQIKGQWYYPSENYSYDETGIASWYGDDFHQQMTANGEVFNKNELTAAHKTLPLPSLARVTNLENGRSIVVRVNDRGPFSGARIIDLSQRAAQLLGFEGQGTAKVRVQVLADESKAIADAMRHYGSASPVDSAPVTQPANITQASVQRETLSPIISTPETRRQLRETKPVAEAVQVAVPATSRLYIQAGAFTVHENAAKLQQSLSRYGQTSISTAVVNGNTFYRVRVGPVATVGEADSLLSIIRKTGATSARTVVD